MMQFLVAPLLNFGADFLHLLHLPRGAVRDEAWYEFVEMLFILGAVSLWPDTWIPSPMFALFGQPSVDQAMRKYFFYALPLYWVQTAIVFLFRISAVYDLQASLPSPVVEEIDSVVDFMESSRVARLSGRDDFVEALSRRRHSFYVMQSTVEIYDAGYLDLSVPQRLMATQFLLQRTHARFERAYEEYLNEARLMGLNPVLPFSRL